MSEDKHIAEIARAFTRATVRISFGKNDRQMRRIATSAHRKPTGRFTSRKCGRSFEWTALHERYLMWISEVDSEVLSYFAQPARMIFFDKAFGPEFRAPVYYPDLLRRLANGTIEIIEAMRTRDEVFENPLYEAKIARAAHEFRRRGFKFRVLTAKDDIEIEPLLSNARMIRADRWTELGSEDYMRLGEALKHPRPYREAVEALSESGDFWDVRARARLHALVVRRQASIDVTKKIDPQTLVTRPHVYRHTPGLEADEVAAT
jgi:hypothetical protein